MKRKLESGRRWMELATAYELLAYAAGVGKTKWDGRSKVVVFGSKFGVGARFGVGAWPVIEFVSGGGRVLDLLSPDESGLWPNDYSILCIKMG